MKPKLAWCALALLVVSWDCGAPPPGSVSPEPSRKITTSERAVIGVVARFLHDEIAMNGELWLKGRTVAVGALPHALPAYGSAPFPRDRRTDSVPEFRAAVDSLLAVNAEPARIRSLPKHTDPRIHLVSEYSLDSSYGNPPAPRCASAVVSRIGFSDGGQVAAVYGGVACNLGSGFGEVLLFRKEAKDKWVLADGYYLWTW